MEAQKVKELVENLQKWHANIVRQLNLAANSKDPIKLQGPSGDLITLNEKQSKGIKDGFLIALDIIGEFPVTIEEKSNEEK